MKFRQLRTGAVLEATNEAVIAMMTASDAYAAVEQTKPKKSANGDKEKSTENSVPAE